MLRARSRSALRITVAIAAVAAAVLVPATGASASQVSYNGTVLTYNAGPGEANVSLRLSFPNESGPVTGTVRVTKLARAAVRYRARPGRPVVVKVRLGAVARRAVVTVRATDAAGNSSIVKTRMRLRAP